MEKTSERIFVDTNFFVALFYPNDTLHERCMQFATQLQERNARLVISNLVFSEIVTVLSMRCGRLIGCVVGEELMRSPAIEVVYIDEALHEHAWMLFQEIENKNVSFVDCSSVAVMENESINTIVTFDEKDFNVLRKQYHFRVIN
jgi:predicted nucleic acid-binding protein